MTVLAITSAVALITLWHELRLPEYDENGSAGANYAK